MSDWDSAKITSLVACIVAIIAFILHIVQRRKSKDDAGKGSSLYLLYFSLLCLTVSLVAGLVHKKNSLGRQDAVDTLCFLLAIYLAICSVLESWGYKATVASSLIALFTALSLVIDSL